MSAGKEATLRIAIFLPSLAGGGAERVSIALADCFVGRGLDCDLVLVNARGEFLSRIPRAVRVLDLSATKPRTAIPKLVRYLRREKPVAVLSSLPLTNIAALIASKVLRQYRGRVVTRIATREDLYFSLTGNQESRLDGLLRRFLYRRADATIAISNNVREWLINDGLTEIASTHVIYNPLCTPTYAEAPTESPKASTPTILACGRLVEQKDYPTLIRAFALVNAKRDCTLSILGDGPLRSSLDKLIRDLGVHRAVHFHGFVEDPFTYMRRADVFVHTAVFEGFGNVLLEALAAGCKIVATDGAGAAREVLDEGRFASMVPAGDHVAVANAIEDILNGQNLIPSPKAYLEKFRIDSIADQYLDVLLGNPNWSPQ